MADGEVEVGVDDQLIDEAILGTKDGKERGELGGRGGVGYCVARDPPSNGRKRSTSVEGCSCTGDASAAKKCEGSMC